MTLTQIILYLVVKWIPSSSGMILESTSPPNTILSVLASPNVNVPPLNVVVPVTVKLPPIEAFPPTLRFPVTLFIASTTFVPSQNTNPVVPLGIAIPVPEAVLTVTACPVAFFTIYILLAAGHIRVAAPLRSEVVSVRLSIAALDSDVEPSAVDKVAELVLQVFIVFRPAMASSIILVTLDLGKETTTVKLLKNMERYVPQIFLATIKT